MREDEPRWGIDTIVSGMRTTRFVVQGMTRTYWDFYLGFGLFVMVLLLFTAILAWQLGGLPAEVLRTMPLVRWGLALCFIVVTYTSWRYFFVAPIVFSAVIAVCLILAAWRSAAA